MVTITKIFTRTILLENIIRCEDGMYILRLYVIVRDINDIFKARWFCYGIFGIRSKESKCYPTTHWGLITSLVFMLQCHTQFFQNLQSMSLLLLHLFKPKSITLFCFQFLYKLCMYNTNSISPLHLMPLALYTMASHVCGSGSALLWFIIDDIWSKRRY